MKNYFRAVSCGLLFGASAISQLPSVVGIFASQQKAEDEVIKRIDQTRKSASLPPLKRVKASESELQLVCTAALTGHEVQDPLLGNLHTYVTDDLNEETEFIKLVALGTSGTSDGGRRWRVYSDKKWPRLSVVVLLDITSKSEHPVYRVGVAQRPSAFSESIAPITGDNPRTDSKDWKKQVVPACVVR